MTAVHPGRLKIRAARVSNAYPDPEAFLVQVQEYFQHYADRVLRPGRKSKPEVLPAYRAPGQVLKALERELRPQLEESPSTALPLVDKLWEENWLEIRLLAGDLLGSIPPINAEPITGRLLKWVSSPASDTIRGKIVRAGFSRVIAERPQAALDALGRLLQKPDERQLEAAVDLIHILSEDPAFQDLPTLFLHLSTILEPDQEILTGELAAALRSLINRSEQETFLFLERQLSLAGKPRIYRLIRLLLPEFSPPRRAALKDKLSTLS